MIHGGCRSIVRRLWLTIAGVGISLAYVIVCFRSKADTQVNVAQFLTVAFALVMAGTTVGMYHDNAFGARLHL
jgi:hypothetical protein